MDGATIKVRVDCTWKLIVLENVEQLVRILTDAECRALERDLQKVLDTWVHKKTSTGDEF